MKVNIRLPSFNKVSDLDTMRKRLFKGGLAGLVIKISAGIIYFISFALIAKASTAEDYGRFVAAFSLALFLGQVSTFGQPKTVLRYLGQYSVKETSSEASGVFLHTLKTVWRVSLAVAALNAIVWLLLAIFSPDSDQTHMLLASLLIIPLALAEFLSHALRGLQKLVSAMVPRDIIWRLSILTMAGYFMIISHSPSATELMVITSLILAFVCCFQLFMAIRYRNDRFGNELSFNDQPMWKKTALGQWGLNIFSTSFPHITTLYVSLFLSAIEASAFFSSIRIVSLLSMPLIAINLVSAPLIARYINSGENKKVRNICKISAGLIVPVVAVGALIIVLSGTQMLELFNSDFTQYDNALIILCISYTLNALLGPTGSLMQMSGNERIFLKFTVISNILGLSLLPILTSEFGLAGASISCLIASCGWNICVWIWAMKYMNVDSSVFSLFYKQKS